MKLVKKYFPFLYQIIKKIYININTKLLKFLGILFFLTKSKNKNIVITIYDAIGDTLYACAYYNELVKEKGDKYVLFVSKLRQEFVNRYGFKKVYYYNSFQKKIIESLIFSNTFKKILNYRKRKNILICYPWFYFDKKLHFTYNYDFLTMIKNDIFKLENKNPSIDYVKLENKQIPLDITKKFVILNYLSNSENLPLCIFEEIVNKLNQKGYVCYTNTYGDKDEITGTIKFRSTLNDFAIASKYASAVISIRTGGLDYIIPYAKRIFAIYDNDADIQIYNLGQWNTNCEIHEYLYESKDSSNLSNQIINDFLLSCEDD